MVKKRVERLRDHLRGHAGAGVGHAPATGTRPRACPAARRPADRSAVGGLDGDPTPVRHGVGALMQRLSSAFSNWDGSTTRATGPPIRASRPARRVDRARTRSSMPSTRAFTSVPSARGSAGARTPAGGGSAPPRASSPLGGGHVLVDVLEPSLVDAGGHHYQAAEIPASRLLKSCARPPVSCRPPPSSAIAGVAPRRSSTRPCARRHAVPRSRSGRATG